eukprot:TRINITY_DN1745_c0_g1_i1.p1 TRINITY_DN1745_c0_g1~~TRINITY_DN1745_c0_g1_i1.p1  ORF type:complete len:406 (-),score=119.28 TRINITY_DN1745_c0_g1_i1:33-1097(-)
MNIPAENRPFCTIEPNEARVSVPDKRYDWLVDHWKPASAVPAFLQVTDIAGLVRGASTGEGLGNAFLSHIRAVDGIFHVVRLFEAADVTHVEGDLDPIRDLQIIEEELIIKDIEAVTKALESAEGSVKRTPKDKSAVDHLATVKKVMGLLENKTPVRFGDWKAAEADIVNDLLLLTAKPVVYLLNLSEEDYIRKKNKWLVKIKNWVDARKFKETIIPFSAGLELQVSNLPTEDEKKKFLTESKTTSVIAKIIRIGYDVLSLVHFFTCGKDEVKCWTIRKNTKAPNAAGVIHTDFLAGFICAEVQKFEDYKALGSEGAVKAAGKYLQQGKNYVVEDGDIIFFKVNAGAGLKGKKK